MLKAHFCLSKIKQYGQTESTERKCIQIDSLLKTGSSLTYLDYFVFYVFVFKFLMNDSHTEFVSFQLMVYLTPSSLVFTDIHKFYSFVCLFLRNQGILLGLHSIFRRDTSVSLLSNFTLFFMRRKW